MRGFDVVRLPTAMARVFQCAIGCAALLFGHMVGLAPEEGFARAAETAPNTKAPRGCAGDAPALRYYRDVRPEVMQRMAPVDPDNAVGTDLYRSFRPLSLSRAYTPGQLRCWIGRGDPIAEYLLFIRSGELDFLPDLARAPLSRSEVERLKRAARAHSCVDLPDPAVRAYFGCDAGLPEAAYLLIACEASKADACRIDPADRPPLCRQAVKAAFPISACNDLVER